MRSDPDSPQTDWYEVPFPSRIVTLAVAAAIGGAVAIALVLFLGLVRGELALAIFFPVLYAVTVGLIFYGHLRRLPRRIGYSDEAIHIEYRNGRTLFLPWDQMGRVEIVHLLGDDHADLWYADGSREPRAQIYGEAARELKRRFDTSLARH